MMIKHALSGAAGLALLASGTAYAAVPGAASAASSPVAYVASAGNGNTGELLPINTATGQPGPGISLGRGIYGLTPSLDGKTLYIMNALKNEVVPLSTATSKLGQPITTGQDPITMAFTPKRPDWLCHGPGG
jgi:DNA-binding beta-propeller fold protein YncE